MNSEKALEQWNKVKSVRGKDLVALIGMQEATKVEKKRKVTDKITTKAKKDMVVEVKKELEVEDKKAKLRVKKVKDLALQNKESDAFVAQQVAEHDAKVKAWWRAEMLKKRQALLAKIEQDKQDAIDKAEEAKDKADEDKLGIIP